MTMILHRSLFTWNPGRASRDLFGEISLGGRTRATAFSTALLIVFGAGEGGRKEGNFAEGDLDLDARTFPEDLVLDVVLVALN